MRIARKLAAIIAADVVSYSRLMGVDEAETLAALKTHRRDLIDPDIAEHQGRIVKTTGDGLLIEFPSVIEAVQCAVEVQRAMQERNSDVPTDHRIEFRVGINLGDIIIDGDDIYGDGVNVAARLEGLAEANGICVSRESYTIRCATSWVLASRIWVSGSSKTSPVRSASSGLQHRISDCGHNRQTPPSRYRTNRRLPYCLSPTLAGIQSRR